MLKKKGPLEPVLAFDVVSKQFFVHYTDLRGCNIDVNTRASMLHSFSFIPELKFDGEKTFKPYMNHQTCGNVKLIHQLIFFLALKHTRNGTNLLQNLFQLNSFSLIEKSSAFSCTQEVATR